MFSVGPNLSFNQTVAINSVSDNSGNRYWLHLLKQQTNLLSICTCNSILLSTFHDQLVACEPILAIIKSFKFTEVLQQFAFVTSKCSTCDIELSVFYTCELRLYLQIWMSLTPVHSEVTILWCFLVWHSLNMLNECIITLRALQLAFSNKGSVYLIFCLLSPNEA